jgi:hypothetical protein
LNNSERIKANLSHIKRTTKAGSWCDYLIIFRLLPKELTLFSTGRTDRSLFWWTFMLLKFWCVLNKLLISFTVYYVTSGVWGFL